MYVIVMGEHACMVRRCVPRQREKWSHNVGIIWSRDTAGDRNQQPSSPTEAAACHPGDGELNKPVNSTHCPHCEYTLHIFSLYS